MNERFSRQWKISQKIVPLFSDSAQLSCDSSYNAQSKPSFRTDRAEIQPEYTFLLLS